MAKFGGTRFGHLARVHLCLAVSARAFNNSFQVTQEIMSVMNKPTEVNPNAQFELIAAALNEKRTALTKATENVNHWKKQLGNRRGALPQKYQDRVAAWQYKLHDESHGGYESSRRLAGRVCDYEVARNNLIEAEERLCEMVADILNHVVPGIPFEIRHATDVRPSLLRTVKLGVHELYEAMPGIVNSLTESRNYRLSVPEFGRAVDEEFEWAYSHLASDIQSQWQRAVGLHVENHKLVRSTPIVGERQFVGDSADGRYTGGLATVGACIYAKNQAGEEVPFVSFKELPTVVLEYRLLLDAQEQLRQLVGGKAAQMRQS